MKPQSIPQVDSELGTNRERREDMRNRQTDSPSIAAKTMQPGTAQSRGPRSLFSSFVPAGLTCLLVLLAGPATQASARTFHVFCPSFTISSTLENLAQPGDTILITGACKERLTITKDRITLDGQGSAVLDGTGVAPSAPEFNALITIDGARGITLRDLTVENSSAEGILAKNGAVFALQDVTVQDNGNSGVAVSANSTAELTDCVMRNNQVLGLRVFSGGTVILKGAIDISDNTEGIIVSGQSMLEIRGAQVQVNNSVFFGLTVDRSQVAIFTFSESQRQHADGERKRRVRNPSRQRISECLRRTFRKRRQRHYGLQQWRERHLAAEPG